MKLKKVIGGKFITNKPNQDLMTTVDDGQLSATPYGTNE